MSWADEGPAPSCLRSVRDAGVGVFGISDSAIVDVRCSSLSARVATECDWARRLVLMGWSVGARRSFGSEDADVV